MGIAGPWGLGDTEGAERESRRAFVGRQWRLADIRHSLPAYSDRRALGSSARRIR